MAPLAAGDVEEPSEPIPAGHASDEPDYNAGYTGPGREPYFNFFQGIWVYGQITSTPLDQQAPRTIRGDGDWLTWEDKNSGDVYLHNIPAGTGFFVKRDDALQRAPDLSGDIVVWEDHGNRTGIDIEAYDITTGERRTLTPGPGSNRNPSIDGSLVAWESDRNRTADLWAYDFENDTQFPLVVGADRESDPLVLDGKVYYRSYRFNVWDLFVADPYTGGIEQLTSDAGIQGAPFTNREDVLYVSQTDFGWQLRILDTATLESAATGIKLPDTTFTPAEGDHLIVTARDDGAMQIVTRNITTGENRHVTGGFRLVADPWLQDGIVYLAVRTTNGTSLLSVQVSPFAWTPRPELTIFSPATGTRWTSPLSVSGLFKKPAEWVEPATFTYRIDDEPPVAIAPTERFRFLLDPTGFTTGGHTVTIRATFREGPPVEQSVILIVPRVEETLDVEQLAEIYHSQVVASAMRQYVTSNPLSFALLALVLVLLVVLVLRLWLFLKPKRRRVVVEYVPPE